MKTFLDGDFKNVQGRLNAWFAGENLKLQAYRDDDAGTGPDLYTIGYARAFNIPIEDVDKEKRRRGKAMELGCGFQGGVGAIVKMASTVGLRIDALPAPVHEAVGNEDWDKWLEKYPKAIDKRGLPSEQWAAVKILVSRWRTANAKIAASWRLLEEALRNAIDNPGVPLTLDNYRGVTFYREKSILFIRLPSGRNLHYWNPRVRERKKTVLKFPDGTVEPEENFADGPAVEAMIVAGQCERIHKHPVREIRIDGKVDKSSYLDMRTGQLLREDDAAASGQDFMHYVGSRGGKRVDGWGEKVLYGGVICENIIMGAEHDIQALRMVELARTGLFDIDLHTHDSITPEIWAAFSPQLKERFTQIMGAAVPWAPELPIGVSVHEGSTYS